MERTCSMDTKVYFALKFSPKSLFADKITQFRKRFDPKFLNNPTVHLALFNPIKVDGHRIEDFVEEAHDRVGDFFDEYSEQINVRFSGIDCLSTGRQHILFLRPEHPPELEYFSEALIDIANRYQKRDEKRINDKIRLMPIGRYNSREELEEAIHLVKDEINFPLQLSVDSLVVYVKRHGSYFTRTRLHDFVVKSSYGNFSSSFVLF